MISALLKDMKPATPLVMLSLLLSVSAPSLSSASDGGNQPPGTSAQAEFTADDFDWREMVPYLFVAAALPAEQGIKAVLENSRVLRAYVGNGVREECRLDKKPCSAKGDGSMPEEEVSQRIDEIVQEGIFRQQPEHSSPPECGHLCFGKTSPKYPEHP